LKNGTKLIRDEAYPAIYLCELKHDNGVIFVYKNDTKDMGLSEVIAFNELKGAKIVGVESSDSVQVIVGPR